MASDGLLYCPCSGSGSFEALRITPGDAQSFQLIAIQTGVQGAAAKQFKELPAKWLSASLGGDGRVYCPPYNSMRALRIDPGTGSGEVIGRELGNAMDPVRALNKWAGSAT